jgi:N-methylhydantoinase B
MVTAGWNRALNFNLTGKDPRSNKSYVDILFLALKGGSGGTWNSDGYDHIGIINCAGGILAQDYEMFELHDPHFLLKHEYLPDSAGAGRWRGGMSIETEFIIYGEDITGISYGDGIDDDAQAFGIFGGKNGIVNEVKLVYPDGTQRVAKAKEIIRNIPTGTLFKQKAGGGGGYGDPYERPVEKVLDDVKNGLVSIEVAQVDYGVVIDPESHEVDIKATEQLRKGQS